MDSFTEFACLGFFSIPLSALLLRALAALCSLNMNFPAARFMGLLIVWSFLQWGLVRLKGRSLVIGNSRHKAGSSVPGTSFMSFLAPKAQSARPTLRAGRKINRGRKLPIGRVRK